MDINDLTIGQAKELSKMFASNQSDRSSLLDDIIGCYVIVRSRNEGINSGYVKAADDTGIILTQARRIHHHIPLDKNMSWYEGVATSGLCVGSKISNAVEEKIIIEDYSITKCTNLAEKSIRNYKTNEQN